VLNDRIARAKVWLDGKLLDFAESLPETKRGPIHYLQMIRGFQRKRAAEATRDSEPPAENRLALSSMRLIEAYSIENFGRLRLAIQRLFPDLPREPARGNLLSELDQSIRSLNAGGWWSIGMLVRERGRYLYARPVRELPELPTQIESIHVHAHHIVPSIAMLALDVRLTDDAAAELNRVQARPYLSEVAFRSLFRIEVGHSELPVEWVRQRHVRGWVEGLRADVEAALKRLMPPGLFSAAARTRPRLPAIETYVLSAGEAAFSEEWDKQARFWLESYGIESAFNVYRSDLAAFQWPRVEGHRWPVSGHLLTVSREKYLAQVHHPESYASEENAVLYRVEDALHGLMPVVVTLRLLGQTRRVIEELRERVFKRIDTGAPLLSLRPLMLPTRLLAQSKILSRLRAEFSRHEKWISHRMRGWEDLKFVPKLAGRDADLRGDALEWIHHELEMLEEHLGLARHAFAEHFTARNTRAIYLLTFAILALTVVQVLASESIRASLLAAFDAARGWFGFSRP
jgi:hypothetical protein